MDPNESLRIIRLLIAQMRVEDHPVGNQNARLEFVQHARDLAEHVQELDDWLSKEGFLPGAWAIPGERG
jgi:hypothetical protein